jgi:nucleoporin NUP159
MFQFLAFQLLNKRARVRISSLPFGPDDLSTTFRLFAIANAKGWFAAVTQTAPTDFGMYTNPFWVQHP